MSSRESLRDLTGILHGWTFCDEKALVRRINLAEKILGKLPPELKEEGNLCIQPLWDTLYDMVISKSSSPDSSRVYELDLVVALRNNELDLIGIPQYDCPDGEDETQWTRALRGQIAVACGGGVMRKVKARITWEY